MTVRMLLRQVKLENLLSFRNTTVQLRGLNVLIGANASGKSNLIEAIGLLQAAPVDLSRAILRLGGVRVVCSLARRTPTAAIQCSEIHDEPIRYRLEFSEEGSKLLLIRPKPQDLGHLLLRIATCTCVQHGQAGGDAVRREEQIARVGRQLAIEVKGERGVAVNDGLDLSGSNYGRRDEGETQKSKQCVFHLVCSAVKNAGFCSAWIGGLHQLPKISAFELNRRSPKQPP